MPTFNTIPAALMTDSKTNDTTGAIILKYWPIIVAVSVTLVSLGGIYVKLEYIAKAIDRNDSQFQTINERQNVTARDMVEIRGSIARLQDDAVRNAQATTETRARLDVIQDKIRFTPGR